MHTLILESWGIAHSPVGVGGTVISQTPKLFLVIGWEMRFQLSVRVCVRMRKASHSCATTH